MKCPQCNYVSFEGLYSCKKCGFVFARKGSGEAGEDLNSLLFQTDNEGKEKSRKDEPSNVQKTVASIRESLNEIEGTEQGQNAKGFQEQPIQVETDELKLRIDDEYVEKSKQFPDHSEINWEESVPLSSDEIYFGTNDGTVHDVGETADIKKTDVPYTETEEFKTELRRIGEKLQQIDESPVQAEQLNSVTDTTQGFDIAKVKKGGFWIRYAAWIIDNIILNVIGAILLRIGSVAFNLASSGLQNLEAEEMLSIIIPYIVFMFFVDIAYFTYFHGSTGQTPGKMLCKLKVVGLNGERLGYPRAFLRWVGYIPSFVLFLGFLWIVWDTNKQGWHDKIAGSYVVSTK